MGRSGELLRFLREGQDPAAVYAVRPGVIASDVTQLTAFQAAVWSRRGQMVQLLDRAGVVTEARRTEMACLAEAMEVAEIVSYLAVDAGERCR